MNNEAFDQWQVQSDYVAWILAYERADMVCVRLMANLSECSIARAIIIIWNPRSNKTYYITSNPVEVLHLNRIQTRSCVWSWSYGRMLVLVWVAGHGYLWLRASRVSVCLNECVYTYKTLICN